ncbi:MAG: glycosyltransferase family 2 protein [Candidatus Omnitrophica bacterium]|nr:glycosyltransferase family 2 protein [Candidatus Omnitrophota bacterium]
MISIICPFYNEKENLEALCKRLKGTLAPLTQPWEIIFVDDGSTDGGGDLLKRFVSESDPIHILRLERNCGQSAALHAGFRKSRGEILVMLDADLQNPPEEIPRLIAMLDDGCDIVQGIRMKREDTRFKRVVSAIANRFRRAALKDCIVDIGCSLRVFRRDVLESFYPYTGAHRFFPAVAQAEGFRVKQVGVRHDKRFRGVSKYTLGNRNLSLLWDVTAFRWMINNRIRTGKQRKTR